MDTTAADVFLLTDGEIWNADHLVAEARAARQRVFAVGIGSAPAEGVLRKLAQATGGACEFVAPNEDAEAAILRMFARLRVPRVDRAEATWPATPAWTTPLASGLFGGETIHAFAGFDSAPSGVLALALHAKSDTKPLTAAAQLGTVIVEDRTLARIAAARRIETASDADQLQLALDYGLLTARTNLLVVHERAADEKATDLPKLAHVAQMHAAGWHGAGTVRSMACLSFDMLDAAEPVARRSLPSSRRSVEGADYSDLHHPAYRPAEVARGHDLGDEMPMFPPPPEPARKRTDAGSPPSTTPETIAALLAKLDAAGVAALPKTLADLGRLGVPREITHQLLMQKLLWVSEEEIVRAFLEALATDDASGKTPAILSRHVARAMRSAFAFAWSRHKLRARARDVVEEWRRIERLSGHGLSPPTLSESVVVR